MDEALTNKVLHALKTIRAPLAQGEYDLHQIVADALEGQNLFYVHEARLAPRCRIDFLVEGQVGIELKKGRPNGPKMKEQAARYAAAADIRALIVVVEKWVNLPNQLAGKPLYTISLNRLWGIALP